MPLFGGNDNKTKFDANEPPQDLVRNYRNYSFVHNFKVHYKQSSVQLFAEAVDITITSKYPGLPPAHWVTDRFNRRRHYGSFKITNVEYKESVAFRIGNVNAKAPVQTPTSRPVTLTASSKFCNKCGTKISSGPRFCNLCGAAQQA